MRNDLKALPQQIRKPDN